jgi:hypothetical protein
MPGTTEPSAHLTGQRLLAAWKPRQNTSVTDSASWVIAILVLAFVVPLTGALGPNTLFFTAHGVPALLWSVGLLLLLGLLWAATYFGLRIVGARCTSVMFDRVATIVVFLLASFGATNVIARLMWPQFWPLAVLLGLIVGLAITWVARQVRLGSVLLIFATLAALLPMVQPLLGAAPVANAATFSDTANPPSVYWIVADELQYPLLINDAGQVRPVFANIRSLQQQATTYTRAFTPANYTDYAMPALFNGVIDVGGMEPGARQDMKQSRGIFPALSTQYSVVMESPLFNFECTGSDCVNASPDAQAGVLTQVGTLIADTAAVAGRVSLGPPLSGNFPSLDGKWRDFFVSDDGAAGSTLAIPAERFIDAITTKQQLSDAPILGLWHTMRTHAPWTVDATGDIMYPRRLPVIPGSHMVGTNKDGRFTTDDLAAMGRRMYADSTLDFDRQVGVFVDYLKETGSYDNAMIIVTADHGVGVTRIRDRRLGDNDDQRWSEVTHVPLIVKYPGQTTPAVVGEPRSTAQIAQTILDSVGATDTGLQLANALDRDPNSAPVFTNVAGGAMTRWTYADQPLIDPWTAQTLPNPSVPLAAFGIGASSLGNPPPEGWQVLREISVQSLVGDSDQMVLIVDRPATACAPEPAVAVRDGRVVGSVLWGRDDVREFSEVASVDNTPVLRGWSILPKAPVDDLVIYCRPA